MTTDVEQIVKTFLKDLQVLESSVTGFLNYDDQDDFLDSLRACGFSFYKRNTIVYETSKRYKSCKFHDSHHYYFNFPIKHPHSRVSFLFQLKLDSHMAPKYLFLDIHS